LLVFKSLTAAADVVEVDGFSRAQPGERLPDGWETVELAGREGGRFRLVEDGGKTVLRLDADTSAASLARAVALDPAAYPFLRWRWRVSNLIDRSDIREKSGDDFPARLYVLFDYPVERLSLLDWAKLKIARAIYGEQVPAAALCYVWDKHAPAGTTVGNAYTDRVRMIVLRSGAASVGEWVSESRNLLADFRAAFAEEPPPVAGIVVAADTDQTGETVTAWFDSIRFARQPEG
jgi:hypothetical protein